jgi:predicted  nucleic acid-binding Zn-ribbon protein
LFPADSPARVERARAGYVKGFYMVTTDVFDRLQVLQDILAEKYELEKEIESSPKEMSHMEELVTRLKKEFIEENDKYNATRDTVSFLKQELEDWTSKRERAEKSMDGISTHREYEATDKEIKDATEGEKEARTKLQREDKNLADIKDRLTEREKFLKEQETELAESKGKIEKEVAEFKEKFARLEEKEKEINRDIDPDICFKFERIIRSKQGRGIVAVKGNVCDGCHMILPAQFANKVRRGEEIVFCPYCSRILFFQELESGEAEYFQVDETGSLADFDADFGEDEFDDDDAEEVAYGEEAASGDVEFEE